MENASPGRSNISHSSFRGAQLNNADLRNVQAQGADFTDAFLMNANLEGANLIGCVFENTNLTGANLQQADLRGVDLQTAILAKAQFDRAIYDETTTLPLLFYPWSKLTWRGIDLDPYRPALPKNDFEQFVIRLQQLFDHRRLDEAMKMLKEFELHSEVSAASLQGIVKNHMEPDSVYACRITANGSFACCNQNLKSCYGQRHSGLCTHMLVLVIGLAKAKQVDLKATMKSILDSKFEWEINEPILTELLTKYKGCGAVDWRPAETIPEDYYVF